jgi:hypothetical protein
MRIFISLTSASKAAMSVSDLTIFTATVLTFTQVLSTEWSLGFFTPTASDLRTRPKHPAPICFPAFVYGMLNMMQIYLFPNNVPSFKRFLGNSHRLS